MPGKKFGFFAIIIWSFLFIPISSGIALNSFKVAIILSSNIRPFLEASSSIQKTLKGDYLLLNYSQNKELVKHYLLSERFDATIAIGPQATKLVYEYGKNIPYKIAIMTLDIKKLIHDENPCGIDLRVPIRFQLEIIEEYLGPNRTIGILYNRKENQWLIQEAQKSAKGLGLTIIPLEVESPSEILGKLKPLFSKLDLLLFIPDSVVISEKIITHLTKKALLKGVGVVGYNRFFYDTGALLSFIIDYQKVGEKATHLLNQVISGKPCDVLMPPVEIKWNKQALKILRGSNPEKWNSKIGEQNE